MTALPQGRQCVCRAVSAGRGEWHGPSAKRQNGGPGAQQPSLLCDTPASLSPWAPSAAPSLAYFLSSALLACPPPAASSQLPTQTKPCHSGQSPEPGVAHVSCSAEVWEPRTVLLVGPRKRAGWVCRRGVGKAELVCAPPYSWSCNLPGPPGPRTPLLAVWAGTGYGCGQSGGCPKGDPREGPGREGTVPRSRVMSQAAPESSDSPHPFKVK